MDQLRVGVIGLGNMGTGHVDYFKKSLVHHAVLTAVCDERAEKREWTKTHLGEAVAFFESAEALYASGIVDAVIIATPHFDHPGAAIKAFACGLHVLIEKPAGVYTGQVRLMNEAAMKSGKVFGIMYNQRTSPLYQKLRDLVQSGELGEIRRTNWIITNWYRSQSYYNSGGWRATWAGEGGGVLLNQCPHQLDLWQWTIDMMPNRVRAFCSFGKYRNIEVEDDVTAYVEYENGATGVFITTTGEAPGTNRYEITGDRGKVVIEGDQLTFWRLRMPESEFNRENQTPFARPECWECKIPVSVEPNEHRAITQNWVDAIIKGTPLLAPGVEGIKGLMLSNAMYLSTWTDGWVNLPIDEDLFKQKLESMMK